jgi:hypothetical protein
MSKVYEIYDRRNQDAIPERTLDEAILKHIGGWDPVQLAGVEERKKKELLHMAGFTLRELEDITTLEHEVADRGSDKSEKHIQIDFNFKDITHILDIHMEEHYGKKYFVISFEDCTDGVMRRMFDVYGNEKCIEWCSNCGEEVVIDAVMYKDQMCPNCSEPIKACNLCSDCDRKCSTCSKES